MCDVTVCILRVGAVYYMQIRKSEQKPPVFILLAYAVAKCKAKLKMQIAQVCTEHCKKLSSTSESTRFFSDDLLGLISCKQGDHTVAVRVLRLATSSERASCKEAQGSGSSWSKWSDSLQVNAETPKPHRKSTSQSRPSSSSSGSRRLHPHLPADFYRSLSLARS